LTDGVAVRAAGAKTPIGANTFGPLIGAKGFDVPVMTITGGGFLLVLVVAAPPSRETAARARTMRNILKNVFI
jgi:hypothetical protein